MNKEEAIEVLNKVIELDCHDMMPYEVDALQYAIHFLESAEEVKK